MTLTQRHYMYKHITKVLSWEIHSFSAPYYLTPSFFIIPKTWILAIIFFPFFSFPFRFPLPSPTLFFLFFPPPHPFSFLTTQEGKCQIIKKNQKTYHNIHTPLLSPPPLPLPLGYLPTTNQPTSAETEIKTLSKISFPLFPSSPFLPSFSFLLFFLFFFFFSLFFIYISERLAG